MQIQTFAPHDQGGDSSADSLVRDLGRIVTEHDATILVEIPTLEGRVAYAAGDKAESWIHKGYQGLPGTPPLDVRPLEDLPHGDYRQMFEVIGGDDVLQELVSYLDARGVTYHIPENQQWMYLLGGTALGKMAALMIGIGFVLVFVGIVLNSHTDAVRRLHGIGLLSRAKAELSAARGTLLTATSAAVVLVDVLLWWYSNTASAYQLVLFQAAFIGIALVACIFALFVGLFLLKIAPVVQLLKGKLPAKSVLVSMFAVRIGACIAVASLSIGALNYTTEWNEQKDEVDGWRNSPSAYGLTLSGARKLEDLHEASGRLASHMRDISSQNRLLYAQFRDSGMTPGSHLDRDIMVYNTTAAENSLSGEVSRSFGEQPRDKQPLVLVPDSLPAAVDSHELLAPIVGEARVHTAVYRAGDSRARTWEVGLDEWMNRAETHDPIVVVMPNDLIGLSDRNLVASVTQHDVLLSSYDDFQRLHDDREVGSFVRAAVPMSQTWSQHHQAMGRILWVYVGGFVATVLLCCIASLAVWLSFMKVFHQRLRAAYLHARWPIRPLLTALGAELIVCACVLYFLFTRAATARAWEAGGSAEGAADPALIALFHVPSSAWWITLALFVSTSIPASGLVLGRRTQRSLVVTRR
ncbi:hypothetical protein F7230_01810 [Corynebacterium sp. 320]|uniref:hypothetical protein n=1 Tax=Corynebacterium TaxID=1716 RepID=UPI00125CCF51|nr:MULTISPECIES: hypothetical protein [Corynebacterium]KAB1503873.1 hypothetical protein F7230_01810 [Corynebacterium sp. 320]KAB1553028.1 hypothetical protein F7233_04785 [Corynebacterium sp. 321]KAB1553751.1 hypothetical protein F7232_01795 [Corynebacterium sp. 319]KAB3528009.1 hypothetical protein F8354_01810 [Corynebacterium sp. 250]KAB3540503.1 hypothetical protein F8390_04530 [Corynebacterium sp. 366]